MTSAGAEHAEAAIGAWVPAWQAIGTELARRVIGGQHGHAADVECGRHE